MRLLFCLLLCLPFLCRAQDPEGKPLSVADVYATALKAFITEYPGSVYDIDSQRYVFVKEKDFLKSIKDTLAGIHLCQVDVYDGSEVYRRFFKKRKKLKVLDMQQMMLWEDEVHTWILPLQIVYQPGKLQKPPRYTGRGCLATFSYGSDKNHYVFKAFYCKAWR